MTPLTGLRVLDLSRLLPGPLCTMILADLGADVVKVEEPVHGDPARRNTGCSGPVDPGFATLNRGKRSVALDLRSAEGRTAFLYLVRGADVLVEQFRPGVMESLGLGYERLSEENPRLVFCSLTGYGQTGPYRRRPGHDLNYVAMTGALALMRQAQPLGVQVADCGAALAAVAAISLALLEREKTGRGQYIDVSMHDTALLFMATVVARELAGTPAGAGQGRLTGGLPWYDTYETSDGRHVALGILEEKFWENFCRAVGRPEWTAVFRGTPKEREALRVDLTHLIRSRTLAEWAELADHVETCLTPVCTVQEAVTHPHTRARGLVYPGPMPDGSTVPMVATPPWFGGVPHRPETPAPYLGEHTLEVLSEVGCPRDLIDVVLAHRV